MKKQLLLGAMLMGAFFTAQAQDSCAAALPITTGTTTVGTVNGEYVAGCWAAAAASPAAEWYVFTATETRLVRVNTDLPANDPATVDTRISVYVGECGALQCYNGSDDVNPAQTGGNYLTNFTFAAVAGQTYYIVFDNRWSNAGFDVEVTLDAIPNCATTAPLSEDWSNPANFEYCWGTSTLDQTQDAVSWGYNDINDLDGDGNADAALMIFPDQTAGSTISKNDIAFTAPLMMAAGENYTVNVVYNAISFSTFVANENLEIVMIDAATGAIASSLAAITNIEMEGAIATNMQNAVTSTTTFTPNATGQYQLGLISTSEGNTGVLVVYEVEITGLAGTNDNTIANLSVFPNPSNNVVNVTADALISNVAIVDLNGRTVKSAKFDGVSEASVNVSDLASGIYMMTVSSDKGTTTKKIVKN